MCGKRESFPNPGSGSLDSGSTPPCSGISRYPGSPSGSPPFLVGGHRHHSLLTPRPVSPQTEYSADCFKKCIKDIMETPIASLISLFLWHLLFSHFNGSETGAHLKIDLCVLIGYYFYFS